MKVLLDECLPHELKDHLKGYEAWTAPEVGWASKRNGELRALMSGRFDVFVTVDRSIEFQRKHDPKAPALIVLVVPNTRVETVVALAPQIVKALGYIKPGKVVHIPPED